MDGKRLRDFWNQEVRALLAVYRQFETLLPSPDTDGAAHRGEDGRYVEALLRSYLQKYLPKDLEVLTGFILRPAVKTGENTLDLTLTEGKYHQVKRMLAAVGNRVEGLHRAQIGDLRMPDNLQPGQWRWLQADELALLKP